MMYAVRTKNTINFQDCSFKKDKIYSRYFDEYKFFLTYFKHFLIIFTIFSPKLVKTLVNENNRDEDSGKFEFDFFL